MLVPHFIPSIQFFPNVPATLEVLRSGSQRPAAQTAEANGPCGLPDATEISKVGLVWVISYDSHASQCRKVISK